jgi:hypothetical protein
MTSRKYWQQIQSFLHGSHSKGVPFLGDVRSLEYSANLGAVATRELVSDQSASDFLDSSAPFHREVIILELDHNAVLKTAPPSVLKLLVDWQATKVTELSWRVRVQQRFHRKIIKLAFDRNMVSEKAPTSVLTLPANWPVN